VTTAADVIAALHQRRQAQAGHVVPPGTFPPGWQDWFDAQPAVDRAQVRAQIEACVDGLAQRPLPPRRGRWNAPFFRLLQWRAPHDPRVDRRWRITALVLDLLLHILMLGMLVWLLYLRFLVLPPTEDDGGQVVQVEFIGRGNAVAGGGAVATAGAAAATAGKNQARQAQATPAAGGTAQSALTAPTPPPAATLPLQADTPARLPVPAEPEVAQPVQVSNVPQPEPDHFQLPPPRPLAAPVRAPQLREVPVRAAVESIPDRPVLQVQTLTHAERALPLRVPEVSSQVQAIETFTPEPGLLARERAAPERALPLRAAPVRAQVQALPLPPESARTPDTGAAGTASAAAGAQAQAGRSNGGQASAATGTGVVQSGTGAGAQAASPGGQGVAARGQGAGPGVKPAPGGWPGAAASDDWGASRRTVAGTGTGTGEAGRAGQGAGHSGLFNPDGSPRLPDDWVKGKRVDLDRAGTWLKRPGMEYRGTRFDKYWIPDGTLLEEWVRRGIKELSIPIPGTGLELKCVVSLLQFGGGCIPVDPNANEQPATGRPAPNIPFKPELQEDNGSVRPQTGQP